ncbi:MAG: cyclase family protein [Dehalococcoidia bacterium]|nr:cyclase family protein [Dehalococcoidia bacterium]
MAIYDVSVPLRPGMPTYADSEPGPVLDFHSLLSRGDSANVSALSVGSHTGTHVDAPVHFIEGRPAVEAMPLDYLVGPAHVLEYRGERHLTAAGLEAAGLPSGARRLLIKTRNGAFWDDDHFHPDFVGLAADAARWLVQRGFVLVGIDYMSIEQFRSPTHEVHHALLDKGIVVLEGLDLRAVPPGEYFMVCAPVKVVGGDGAPARVLLWDSDQRFD